MTEAEDKGKAEKLAAAKKRVAQLQKQQAKKAGKKPAGTGEQSKTGGPATTVTTTETADSPAPVEKVKEEEEEEEEEEVETAPAAAPQPPLAPVQEHGQQEEEVKREHAPEERSSQEPSTSTLPPQSENPEHPTKDTTEEPLPSRTPHGRQPSLSLQSKLRSSSFRRTSLSQQTGQPPFFSPTSPPPATAGVKSPSLPPLNPDGDYIPEVFRKQALRLDELEKENKRLEREVEEVGARWKRSEERLEELREVRGELVMVKEKLGRAEERAGEVEMLKAEITALQRQNALLHSRSHRTNSVSASGSGNAESPPAALLAQLDSKSATIEAMELEISNLRAQLSSQSSTTSATQEQVSALEDKLSRSEATLEKTQRELADAKHSLTRAVEKAVKEGVDKTSSETLIKNLERQLQEAEAAKSEADKKIETLEKKLQALGNLHKESENRSSIRLRERDKFEKDATTLKRKLITIENENLRLREEREHMRKQEVSNVGDEEGLDELEDEARQRLERRVRELEGENFDLRRGIWQERKSELSAGASHRDGGDLEDDLADRSSSAGAFDDVDLVGGLPGTGSDHSRRKSMASGRHQQQQQQQKHSSFTTVLSSGLAAFRGESGSPTAGHDRHRSRAVSNISHVQNLFSEKDGEVGSHADAEAWAAEEKRMRDERTKEIHEALKNWKGWRLDLVESRYGAQGAGVGLGEIFEV
ncbi:M protein repeat protein [Paracoccidioides lutzii Pb01]|uniref:M protein repeat protein n=1 Tax=Paracoccidioides lutzii (strain ATCC MYA-826 / Pb01) TaxID=502779 RepID=C1H522_PARBA|nr:M protein repeat protein [Paracoccidioides lutzii Pb01]EEH34816.1 M protein repeat protein [Paracoccidioides lutzii Pb01]